ncbi:MAG TPA: hypothetical protein VMQ81_06140 [Acidimicrobiia bacterium]|nr:hypothetical protein [Acidimicrobiia bacterium]
MVKTFFEAWCSREFGRLDGWIDGEIIETLRGALPAVPLEVLRADVLTVDDGLRFEFRFRVPSQDAAGHVVEERVLVHADGDRVTAVDLFGTRLRSRSQELVAS